MILSDLERLSKIFNESKRRAVSLRVATAELLVIINYDLLAAAVKRFSE